MKPDFMIVSGNVNATWRLRSLNCWVSRLANVASSGLPTPKSMCNSMNRFVTETFYRPVFLSARE